jgi:two-component system, chemotaxis family, chemotaxis protein CheY
VFRNYFGIANAAGCPLQAAAEELRLNLNVLVVDDSAAIRKILLRVLSQSDLPIDAVFEANDGLEALKVLETTPVNLVLSDINMPNMDGLDFLTKVRANARWKDLIILMVTTEGSQAKVLEAVRLGANGYVRKPFTSDQIKDKVMSCLKERAA